MGYTYTKGTTAIEFFDYDMHTYSIRADKIINDYADLKDVINRFEADHSQFDYTDYFNRATFHKAAREYTTQVLKRQDFYQLVFEYQGQPYRIKTKKVTKVWKIRKLADKVTEYKTIQTISLVDDATDELLGIKEVLGEIDQLELEEMLDF